VGEVLKLPLLLMAACRQFKLLLHRSWRQITRDKATAIARLMSNLSSAVIFGAIFFRMQKKQSNIQDRMGLLQVGFEPSTHRSC
jgi:hypothetical protein